MADGLMSGATARVRSAQDEVARVTGLPPDAVPVQTHMVQTMKTMVPHVENAASAVLQSVGDATPLVAAAEKALDGHDSVAMKNALDALQTLMRSTMSSMTTAIDEVRAAVDAITEDNQKLAVIGGELTHKITTTKAEADAAGSEADALESKKWWWLLLGPFGLVGLAVCIGEIVTAQNTVNDLRGRMNQLRGQATQFTKVQADLDLLKHDVPDLSSTLLSLQSGLDFLLGDATNIVADAGKADSPLARAFLMMTKHQLDTLRLDAS